MEVFYFREGTSWDSNPDFPATLGYFPISRATRLNYAANNGYRI